MNKSQVLDALIEECKSIKRWEDANPEVGMGMPLHWIVGEATKNIIAQARQWGYSDMNALEADLQESAEYILRLRRLDGK